MKDDPYKKSANKYDTFVEPFNRDLRQIGLKLHPPTEGMRVLDVGCGTGTTLQLYQKAGCIVSGIDSSPAMLKIAQQKLDHQAELLLDDASEMQYPDDTFDLAIGMLTLHEMPEIVRTKVLTEMMRVIKNEGRILIVDFHPGSISFPKGWIYKAVIFFFEITAGYEHFKNFRNFISRDGIPGLIESQSLTLEKVKIVGGGNLGLYVVSAPAPI
jgi:demethylmenaquinone methyltransferase/2-methoxy-6-polyprenyl-1,4-benzoquinol methylase